MKLAPCAGRARRNSIFTPICGIMRIAPSAGSFSAPPEFWPAPEQEKSRYEQHQNSASDEDYVAFLRQLSDPLIKMLPKGARGLDFGAGPTSDGRPVLCELLADAGIKCLPYDPYFFPKMPEGAF